MTGEESKLVQYIFWIALWFWMLLDKTDYCFSLLERHCLNLVSIKFLRFRSQSPPPPIDLNFHKRFDLKIIYRILKRFLLVIDCFYSYLCRFNDTRGRFIIKTFIKPLRLILYCCPFCRSLSFIAVQVKSNFENKQWQTLQSFGLRCSSCAESNANQFK